MKREDSIKLLKQQKAKLTDQNLDEVHWIDETSNIVSNIFGKDSDQLEQVRDLNINIDNNKYYGGDNNPLRYRERAAKYIESYITQVENFTYEKVVSYNIDKEYKFSKSTIYTVVPIIISATFGLGFYFGNNKFDGEKNKLVDQDRSLSSDTTSLKQQLFENSNLLKSKDSILNSGLNKSKLDTVQAK